MKNGRRRRRPVKRVGAGVSSSSPSSSSSSSRRGKGVVQRVLCIYVCLLYTFSRRIVGLRILWKSEQLPKQKRAILQLTFQSYVYFYYMYSLVHYCVHPMHDYSSFGTRLAHSSPRQSRIFILHFLCLVATTSLTRSSSLVPSWPTPRFKDRNRRL